MKAFTCMHLTKSKFQLNISTLSCGFSGIRSTLLPTLLIAIHNIACSDFSRKHDHCKWWAIMNILFVEFQQVVHSTNFFFFFQIFVENYLNLKRSLFLPLLIFLHAIFQLNLLASGPVISFYLSGLFGREFWVFINGRCFVDLCLNAVGGAGRFEAADDGSASSTSCFFFFFLYSSSLSNVFKMTIWCFLEHQFCGTFLYVFLCTLSIFLW